MILCQTDLCATVAFALATMSEPFVKIKNVDALKERQVNEDGSETSDPIIWPGTVTELEEVKELKQVREKDELPKEWDIVITSKFLEDPVTARVQSWLEIGTRIQFVLDPNDENGKTTAKTALFEYWEYDPQIGKSVKKTNGDWVILCASNY